MAVYTVDFWQAYEDITFCYVPSECEIHIEDTGHMPVFHDSPNKRTQGKIGKNVGGVCKEAELMAIGLERLGFKVVRHRNKTYAKLDAEQFRRLTGWQGRTNEHARDAAMLIFK